MCFGRMVHVTVVDSAGEAGVARCGTDAAFFLIPSQCGSAAVVL